MENELVQYRVRVINGNHNTSIFPYLYITDPGKTYTKIQELKKEHPEYSFDIKKVRKITIYEQITENELELLAKDQIQRESIKETGLR